MRIAALADIHGNLPALRAVLAELDADPVEAIVVCGDTCGGALVRASLELLAARPEPVHWVRGNADREAVEAFDGAEVGDDEVGRAAAFSAAELDRPWRDRVAAWPIRLELDGVCFCHGSPRSDEEILTRATPDEVALAAIAGVEAALVVGGHTHQQLLRQLPGGRVLANAGSVGVPYEGRPGAFWMRVTDGRAERRETTYDVAAALTELEAAGFGDTRSQLAEALLEPVDADWVTRFFEAQAGRGAPPV